MLKLIAGASLLAISLSSYYSFEASPAHPRVVTPPEETYQKFCSSCHGEKVEAFVDRKWKYGTAKADIVKSITNGYPDNGMPSWGPALKAEEIDALADLIVKNVQEGKKFVFDDKPTSPVFAAADLTVKLDTIASGLHNPWGMAFLPDGDLLITDRTGEMYRLDNKRKRTQIEGVPAVVAEGQGGLMDVEVHPNFAKNGLVYLSYSAGKEENGQKLATTAVLCAKLDGAKLTNQKVIFEALPYSKTRHHYGSRLEFGKDGYLYITVGDRGNEKQNPQSLESDCGKVHRVKDDGTAPTDNPFVGKGKATVYSYGHRNLQGMTLNPTTGEIWTHEHGPRGGDEINIVQKANNYGWPIISYGINYDGTTFTNLTAKDGMQQPLHYWIPSIAPSGMVFVTGDKYKAWKGNLLVGSLRFKYLNRCVIEGGKVVKEEILLKNLGRMRNVIMGKDGYIYVAVEDPGYVFRLMPVEGQKASLK